MATWEVPRSSEVFPYPSTREVVEAARPERVKEKGYYNIPFLKRPVWGWEIAFYFAFEGISAGAYVLSTMATLFANGRHDKLVRTARYLSLACLLPCPPLLVLDLGRRERFHHMLRVFKPISPMNVGAWALSTYSIPVTLLAAQQAADDGLPFTAGVVQKAVTPLPARAIAVAGLPSCMTMISYPGVLLSMASTPIWTRTPFVGALISCSSISMAAAALSLLLHRSGENEGSLRILRKVETVASLGETVALAGHLAGTGKTAARPLLTGKHAGQFWLGAVACGLLLPALLNFRRKENNRRGGIVTSLLSLAGGLALKWALTYAGHQSALDPEANRVASQPSRSAPGWMPPPPSSSRA
jgi:formate-dependent nitrite reductase membrane component NrfD